MIPLLIIIVALAIPVACFSRLFLGMFMPKIRALIAKRPWTHAAWFLVSIGIVAILLNPLLVMPKRRPGTFHPVPNDFYWTIISSHQAEEITRKDGIIFLCYFERHGPMYFAIREDEAKATRQEALRGIVTRIAGEVDRPVDETRMTRLAMLTKREFADINSFREWWDQAGSDFVFDEEAHLRLRDYRFGKKRTNDHHQRLIDKQREETLKIEREVILKGEYRTRVSPRSA